MKIRLLWLIVLMVLSGPVYAAGRWGLLIDQNAEGYWARFGEPVSAGSVALLARYMDSTIIGRARIIWVSPVASYDALLTNVRTQGLNEWTGSLAVGMYAVAKPERLRRFPKVETPIMALWRSLDQLGRRGAPRLARRLQPLVQGVHPRYDRIYDILSPLQQAKWADPVVAYIVHRMCGLAVEHNGCGGKVPADWFPPPPPSQPGAPSGGQ